EEVADVERCGVAVDLFDLAAGEQFVRTEDELATVTGFDPARLAFKADRARAERHPTVLAVDEFDAAFVAGGERAVDGCVVHKWRRALADGPLAEVDAMRTPFEDAAADGLFAVRLLEAADHAAALFEVEAIEQLRVV